MSYKSCLKRKNKILKLYLKTKNKYGSGVYYDRKKNRYIKYSISDTNRKTKIIRRAAHKKTRRTKNLINGSYHKKIYDYYWTIY